MSSHPIILCNRSFLSTAKMQGPSEKPFTLELYNTHSFGRCGPLSVHTSIVIKRRRILNPVELYQLHVQVKPSMTGVEICYFS